MGFDELGLGMQLFQDESWWGAVRPSINFRSSVLGLARCSGSLCLMSARDFCETWELGNCVEKECQGRLNRREDAAARAGSASDAR